MDFSDLNLERTHARHHLHRLTADALLVDASSDRPLNDEEIGIYFDTICNTLFGENMAQDVKSETNLALGKFLEKFKSDPTLSGQDITTCLSYCERLALRLKGKDFKMDNIEMSMYRILVSSLAISMKNTHDSLFNNINSSALKNKFYSRVFGITQKEMNLMEIQMLDYIGHNANISRESFVKTRTRIFLQHNP